MADAFRENFTRQLQSVIGKDNKNGHRARCSSYEGCCRRLRFKTIHRFPSGPTSHLH